MVAGKATQAEAGSRRPLAAFAKEHKMARFPTREADVAALAGTIAFGLVENAEDFPDCPVSVEVLQESLARYNRAKEIAASAQGGAAEAFEEKQDAVQDLTDKMKNVLRYAEIAVRQDEAKL